jgi:hypothetical protein
LGDGDGSSVINATASDIAAAVHLSGQELAGSVKLGGSFLKDMVPPSRPLSHLPASLDALPEFNEIIRACWQQRELRRPTAGTLHAQLHALLARCMETERRSVDQSHLTPQATNSL